MFILIVPLVVVLVACCLAVSLTFLCLIAINSLNYIIIPRNVYIYVYVSLFLLSLNQRKLCGKMSKVKKREEHATETTGHQSEAQTPAPLTPEQQKIAELTDTLQRLQADFENYKKRADKDAMELVRFANATLIVKFLPLLDTLDAAIRNTTKDNHHQHYAKGLELLHAQLMSVLQAEGLAPIDCVGKKFDPHYHEVMVKEPSENEEGIILEELQRGYVLHKKVLRHSKVKISEGPLSPTSQSS
jgi:molecular chaperone GrpE